MLDGISAKVENFDFSLFESIDFDDLYHQFYKSVSAPESGFLDEDLYTFVEDRYPALIDKNAKFTSMQAILMIMEAVGLVKFVRLDGPVDCPDMFTLFEFVK